MNSLTRTNHNFIQKLYLMVDDPNTNLITWNPGGLVFQIHNIEEFTNKILPLFFKHNNWHSFTRQLNMYGFQRVGNRHTSEDKTWEFRHPNFRKGDVHLLSSIRRRVHNNPPPLPPEVKTNTDSIDYGSSPSTNLHSLLDTVLSRVNQLENQCLTLNNNSKRLHDQFQNTQSLQLDQLKLIRKMSSLFSIMNSNISDHSLRETYNNQIGQLIQETNRIAHSIDLNHESLPSHPVSQFTSFELNPHATTFVPDTLPSIQSILQSSRSDNAPLNHSSHNQSIQSQDSPFPPASILPSLHLPSTKVPKTSRNQYEPYPIRHPTTSGTHLSSDDHHHRKSSTPQSEPRRFFF